MPLGLSQDQHGVWCSSGDPECAADQTLSSSVRGPLMILPSGTYLPTYQPSPSGTYLPTYLPSPSGTYLATYLALLEPT
eukprot:1144361-Amorphochlora_amoeboformis.AAC.1